MRVAVNASSARIGGGLTYARHQLRALEAQPAIELQVWTSPWNHSALSRDLNSDCIQMPAWNASDRYVREQLKYLRADADVIYAIGNFGVVLPWGPPAVVAMQNPNYVGPGRTMPWNLSWRRKSKIWLSHAGLKQATKIVAISQYIYDCIVDDLPELQDKVDLIQSGAPSDFGVKQPRDMSPDTNPLANPYYVSLANDYPHKHLRLLVDSWIVAFGSSTCPPHLVMIGELKESTLEYVTKSLPSHLKPCVHLLGPVGDRQRVASLVRNARGLVSSSSLEAFPLTPGEAASLRTPALLADIPAHREVAPDATFFKVGSAESLSEAWQAFDTNPPSAPGLPNYITWEENAQLLVRTLTAAAHAHRKAT